MLDFAKNTLGAKTYLGHTNGSRLPLANLNGANVGLKAWDEQVHFATRASPSADLRQFAAAVGAGLEMKANVVFVPGLVDIDQVEAIAAWLASLNPEIPFHIMGYIPVPGQPYERPDHGADGRGGALLPTHLPRVACSHLTSSEALDLTARDDRFAVKQIA